MNRAHMAYDHGGLESLKPKPSGGRKRENMTLENEEALLARFARAAGAGEMLNIHDLKAAYEKAIGHETSKSMIYNGWRKLMPRPFHPRRDITAQNAFKKWLSKCCEESQAGCPAGEAVAARFGRINRPRPCWAPIGIRPEVASQLIREYIYLYGAVSPKDGTCVYLIMPRSDTACFQVFLNALSRKFARQDILLILDGAPNHRCRDLVLPGNISLLFLPPYSPELKPEGKSLGGNPRKDLQELRAQIN